MTAPQKEFLVERVLKENGFDAFTPVEWRWRRVRHRSKKREQYAKPKLRGYVFLSLEGGAMALEGVLMSRAKVRYLGEGGMPLALPEPSVARVRAMSEAPRKIRARNSHMTFRVGEKVRITEGPFTDHVVDIREIRGENARVVLELFNSAREVSIGLSELEAA